MAGGGPISSGGNSNYDSSKSYAVPMTIMTALFFMIGFITVLNDVLIPSLKEVFHLQSWQAILIQFCFFAAYFVVSPFAGLIIDRIGYKKGLMLGLGVTALGLFLFIPAASLVVYGLFLFALFTVGSGFAILQVAINPYIPLLGSPETASSRLNLGGAFNSFATFVGPIIGGALILDPNVVGEVEKAASVKGPYIVLGIITIAIAVILNFIKLPKIEGESVADKADDSPFDFKHLIYGAGAIFFYVGTEVAIGSLLILYLTESSTVPIEETSASYLLAYYWGGAMVGRFVGFVVLQKIKAQVGLRTVAGVAFLLVLFSMFGFAINNYLGISVLEIGGEHGFGIHLRPIVIPLSALLLVLVGLCNSIMWPSIFSLGVRALGPYTSKGSGIMVSMVLGGAVVPLIQSVIAKGIKFSDDSYLFGFEGIGYRFSFIVCLVCYAYIFMFGYKWYKAGKVKEVYDNED